MNSFAQISVKTEYISNSKFYDAVSDSNIGDGSAMIYSVGALVPLSMKAPEEDDPYQRPTVWGVSLSGSFVQMHNHHFPVGKELPSQVMNLGVTALHLRPLKERWSMLMALGAGSYTPENRLSSIHIGENVVANGAVVFIWHWKPNLEIGGGAALNNTFGYPMLFPALYVKYKGGFADKFTIEAASIDGAGEVRQFLSITIPMISPTLFFVMMMTIINTFQTFDIIYLMIERISPAVPYTDSLIVYFYRNAFMYSKKGYASAIAVLLFVIIMIISMIQMKLQKKWVIYD